MRATKPGVLWTEGGALNGSSGSTKCRISLVMLIRVGFLLGFIVALLSARCTVVVKGGMGGWMRFGGSVCS
jgi:hypothetical protein